MENILMEEITKKDINYILNIAEILRIQNEISPLNIFLIVEIILKNLTSKDLESTRQVNSLWRTESLKLYRKDWTHIRFDDMDLPGSLEKYVNVKKYHEAFHIFLPNSHDPTDVKKLFKFKHVIYKFVCDPEVKIKSLGLIITNERSGTGFRYLSQLLINLPRLEMLLLKVDVWNWNEAIQLDWMHFKVNHLLKLKHLSLDFSDDETVEVDLSRISRIWKTLIRMAPNINGITTNFECCRASYFKTYFQEMQTIQNAWVITKDPIMPFQELSHLTIFHIPEGCFNLLLNFLQPIKLFRVSGLSPLEVGFDLEMFLERNAQTLKWFTLSFKTAREVEIGTLYKVRFPHMPKLSFLGFTMGNTNLFGESIQWCPGDLFGIQEIFLMGNDKFKKKCLSLCYLDFGDCEYFYRILPPLNMHGFSFQIKSKSSQCLHL